MAARILPRRTMSAKVYYLAGLIRPGEGAVAAAIRGRFVQWSGVQAARDIPPNRVDLDKHQPRERDIMLVSRSGFDPQLSCSR